MRKRIYVLLWGAVLFWGAAPVVSAAGYPATPQTSSTTPKKKKTSAKSKKKGKVKGQAAPTPDRIKEIQAALQKDGSYQGEPTGKWDAASADAMSKFQEKNGFPASGKIDALSLNKLGLGSETAGKGAPGPAAKPAASPVTPAPASTAEAPATTTSAVPADPPAK
jgi:peptidoglycan hydrolase-like protein with peptidoglycan-binding domain